MTYRNFIYIFYYIFNNPLFHAVFQLYNLKKNYKYSLFK